MEANLSENMRNTVNFSKEEAIRLKNGAIGVEHLYLGMIRVGECSGLNMLAALGNSGISLFPLLLNLLIAQYHIV